MTHDLNDKHYELECLLGKEDLLLALPILKKKCKGVKTECAWHLFVDDDEPLSNPTKYDLQDWYSLKGTRIVLRELGYLNTPTSHLYHGPYRDCSSSGENIRICPITGVILETYLTDYGVENELEYFTTSLIKERITKHDWFFIHQVAEQLRDNDDQWAVFGSDFLKFLAFLRDRKKLK